MLDSGMVNSLSDIAQKESLTRARVTQIMNLLKLTPEIREYLKNLNGPWLLSVFNEKRLRPIARINDK